MNGNRINENKSESKNRSTNTGSASVLRSVFDGSILLREQIIGSVPFLLFVTFLGSMLIANTYVVERNARKVEQLTKEITELRIKHKLTKSDLMYLTNQSEITRMLASRGLMPSTVPPTRIKNQKESKNFLGNLFN